MVKRVRQGGLRALEWAVGSFMPDQHLVRVLNQRLIPQAVNFGGGPEFSALGYGSYRTNTAFMDKVAETYGPVQRSINRKLKQALDPNGILAPGKSGIRLGKRKSVFHVDKLSKKRN